MQRTQNDDIQQSLKKRKNGETFKPYDPHKPKKLRQSRKNQPGSTSDKQKKNTQNKVKDIKMYTPKEEITINEGKGTTSTRIKTIFDTSVFKIKENTISQQQAQLQELPTLPQRPAPAESQPSQSNAVNKIGIGGLLNPVPVLNPAMNVHFLLNTEPSQPVPSSGEPPILPQQPAHAKSQSPQSNAVNKIGIDGLLNPVPVPNPAMNVHFLLNTKPSQPVPSSVTKIQGLLNPEPTSPGNVGNFIYNNNRFFSSTTEDNNDVQTRKDERKEEGIEYNVVKNS